MSTPGPPIGQESWLAFLDEGIRNVHDYASCTHVLKNFEAALDTEVGSLSIWMAYCEFFHTLYADALNPRTPGSRMARWPDHDIVAGINTFGLDNTLQLWQRGYECIRYRLNDSHILWDRWISLEMEQLRRTQTPEGVLRITQLYRHRLTTPHIKWEQTSSNFSTFLSTYKREAWESEMAQITEAAQTAKAIMANHRVDFEFKLEKAQRENRQDVERTVFLEYLDWELQNIHHLRQRRNPQVEINHDVCSGLFHRALTGMFSRDEGAWEDYICHIAQIGDPDLVILEKALKRATDHCPWSGNLWSRYILTAEQAGEPFEAVEKIKHSATASPQLLEGGLESLLSMYIAWCGFLKRQAMEKGGESLDHADMGFAAALEDIKIQGRKMYNNEYEGDPQFRVERIYIEYMTEAKHNIPDARAYWENLARRPNYARSYAFWVHYFQWECLVYGYQLLSVTPASATAHPKAAPRPEHATNILRRAVEQQNLDFPAEMLQMYLQHCQEYECVSNIRIAQDVVRRIGKAVVKRQLAEHAAYAQAQAQAEADVQAQVAAQVQAQTQSHILQVQFQAQQRSQDRNGHYASHQTGSYSESGPGQLAHSGSGSPPGKRKRDDVDNSAGDLPKRLKHEELQTGYGSTPLPATHASEPPKRDRENSSVLIANLPKTVNVSAIKRNFREFGYIINVQLVPEKDGNSSLAIVEFDNPDDAANFIALRDQKYFEDHCIRVSSAHNLTVFVTNYPPTADAAWMHKFFKDCGDIIEIRWPSLKYNSTRRFCYITFHTIEASTAAVGLNHRLVDQHRIEIKFSDPTNKRRRQGATAEGREVYVGNLDGTATQENLRAVFEKYGTIDSVRVLTGMNGRPWSTGFVTFEKKEDADKAVVELDNTKYMSRILKVSVSQHRNFKTTSKMSADDTSADVDGQGDAVMYESGSSSSEIEARSMALMNLPDTVNDARVKALVEKYGKVRRLVLLPVQGTAKIEFGDAAATGKAQLALNGKEFEGRRLRTGTLRDLAAVTRRNGSEGAGSGDVTSSIPATKLFAPTRRLPIKNAATKGSGLVVASKKQLASDDAGSASSTPATYTNTTGENSDSSVPKSNADFKAMFLAGRK